jgi:hypothetical protein
MRRIARNEPSLCARLLKHGYNATISHFCTLFVFSLD